MSTLENKAGDISFKRAMICYIGISVFCVIFYLVYDQFSHGVHSPYMTWLFGWPFLLGVLPCGFFSKCRLVHSPRRFSFNIWNSGVAALTVSSLLRGIFEIAGTTSDYQEWLMGAGGLMLAVGAVGYFIGR